MKTILIIILLAVLGFGTWKLIQTKPSEDTQSAIVSDQVNITPSENQANSPDAQTPTASPDVAGKKINNDKVTIAYTGFGPGKKHTGGFSNVDSNLSLSKTGDVSGTITVMMDSLTSDTDKLTTHLKSPDFFDVATYPKATFVVTEDLTASTCKGDNVRCKAPYLYGNLTVHGVTKGVAFPVVRSQTAYTATFTIDMKEFGIDQTFANEVIEIRVNVPLI